MSQLFVKICGITRLQDAELAVELGATALGFIFWPRSPRYIAPDQARAIVQQLPATVTKVGVFVDEPIDLVTQMLEFVGLGMAQLHGAESPEYCRQLGQTRTIKAVAMKNGAPPAVGDFDDDVLILLDAHDPSRYGGTGRTVDWNAARQIAAARKTILSGGLNAANVRAAIDAVQPHGVDVSSGVESAPGVKDAARLKSFFEALNG